MANLNRIILAGKVLDDPDSKFTVEGYPVTKFRLEVARYQREGAPQEHDVIDIIAWRKLAELCGERLKKGKLALVEGRIQVKSFDDQSGQRKWVTEVVARTMQILDGERQAQKSATEAASAPEPNDDVPEPEEDLPF